MPRRPQTLRAGRPRDTRRDRPYDAAWRRFARWYLGKWPACSCGALATQVDHVVPLARGGAKFDVRNCQGLCAPCHSRKTVERDGGFGRRC